MMKTFRIYLKSTQPTLPSPIEIKGKVVEEDADGVYIIDEQDYRKAMFRKAELIGWIEADESD